MAQPTVHGPPDDAPVPAALPGGGAAAGQPGLDISLPVAGRAVVVVGHGRTAWRRARALLVAGAHVTVLSPDGAWRSDADWASLLPPTAVARVAAASSTAGTLEVRRTPVGALAWAELLTHAWLLHLATPDEALADAVERGCQARRVWCLRETVVADRPAEGSITLVGGGPGDPGLLTVAGRRALADADVVLVDRLAPREGLAALAPGAVVLDVGKTPGHHSVPQDRIEEEMVAHARAGARVVRLKGGDPYVFGRGLEEARAARAAGVDVEVVPGVTSAVAGPGAAGIPLTHRGVAHCFTVVSGHDPLDEEHLRHLAGLAGQGASLVVLMGVATLPHLVAGLARHGLGASTPCAIVERASTPAQRTTTSTLDALVADACAAGVRSPAVVVVGQVVALASAGGTEAAALVPARAVEMAT